jgi:hypothetical protein
MTKRRTVQDGQHPRYWEDGNTDPYFYAVILHEPRNVGFSIVPDVIRIDDNGDDVVSRLGHSILWNRWFPHCLEINVDNPGAAERVMTYEADIFLNGNKTGPIDTNYPVNALSQDFGGNLFAWDIMRNKRLRMRSWKYDGLIPNSALHNFGTEPEMYRVVTCVNESGGVFLPSGGVVEFLPRVANTELWIDIEKVKLLPHKPKTWTIENALMTNEKLLKLQV